MRPKAVSIWYVFCLAARSESRACPTSFFFNSPVRDIVSDVPEDF